MIYEIFFILSTPIYLISIYNFNNCLLGQSIYSKKIEIISYVLYGILLICLYINIQIPFVLFIFSILSFYIISLNYYSNIFKRIFIVLLIYTSILIIEGIVWSFTGYFEISILENLEYNSSIGIIITRLITLIVTHYMNKKNKKIKTVIVPIYFDIMNIVILIGLLYFFIIHIQNSNLSIIHIVASCLFIMIINIIIIVVDCKIYEIISQNSQMNIIKQQNIAYINQIKTIQDSIKKINILKHDMKNHILILESLQKNNKNEEFKEYIKKCII